MAKFKNNKAVDYFYNEKLWKVGEDIQIDNQNEIEHLQSEGFQKVEGE